MKWRLPWRLKTFNTRKSWYSLAIIVVVAVNFNAIAEPVFAHVEYILSHRQSVAVKKGQWDTLEHPSPVNSIHAALLHTGKVLLIAGSGNNQKEFDQKSFRTVLWDPKTNEFKDVPTPWDAFCSGHAFLPDGKLLVAGGTRKYEDLDKTPKQEYQGLPDSYIFDPTTERYEKVSDMTLSRWYPTLVGLGDGRILASSGLDEKGEIIYGHTEIFDPATKQWAKQPDLNRNFPTYPSLILTADSRLFYSGSNAGYGSTSIGRAPGFWNLHGNIFSPVPGLSDPTLMETSATILLPPAQDQKVMVIGGGGVGDSPVATSRTALIDLDDPNPSFSDGPRLKEAVRYPNAVILPDDTVLQSGGSRGYRTDDVLAAAIYHPDTNTFTQVASPRVGRNYHAEALLLPDGRVATFGSNPIDNSFEMRIEIYSPAYLFKGERPKISHAPTEIERGQSFAFATTNPKNIRSAKLMRPSAVTHVTDVEQRSVNLPFAVTDGGIQVEVPGNHNLLPSGWYMAFVTDRQDVPSEAFWVLVK